MPTVTPQTRVVVTVTQYPFVKTPIALVFDKRVPAEAVRLWQVLYALKYEGRDPITVGDVCDALWQKTHRSESNYRDGKAHKREERPASARTFERHRKVLQDTGWLTCRKSGDEIYATLNTEQAAAKPNHGSITQQLGELLQDGDPHALALELLSTLANMAPEALHLALQDLIPAPPTASENSLHSDPEPVIRLSSGVIHLSCDDSPVMTNGSPVMTNGSPEMIRLSPVMTNGSPDSGSSIFMKSLDHERERDSTTTRAPHGAGGGGGGGCVLTSEKFLRDRKFSPQARGRLLSLNLATLTRSYHELAAQGCGAGAMVRQWDDELPETDAFDTQAVQVAPADFTAEMVASLASFLRDGYDKAAAIQETRAWTRPGARAAQEQALAPGRRSRGPALDWDDLAPRRAEATSPGADYRRLAEQQAPDDFTPTMLEVFTRYLREGTPVDDAIESVYIWARQQPS